MKVLLINGSPHNNGNTFKQLRIMEDCFKEKNFEVEWFHIGAQMVRGCIGCDSCADTYRCVFQDDCCNALIEAMVEADAVVIGSPVYFAGPNGALCALLDRVFYSAADYGHLFVHKPAAAVVNCYRAGATAALDRLNKYFTYSEMLVVSSNYWNMIVAAHSDRVERDEEGRKIIETLAANMIWVLERLPGRV